MNLNFIYTPPDFQQPLLKNSPAATLEPAPCDGIAPDNFHATSNHPEYIKIDDGRWILAPESRMDAVFVVKNGRIEVIEARRLTKGDLVVIGRTENGEEGILVHDQGFRQGAANADKFAFRSRGTRETPFSYSYDALYEILKHDRRHGHIVWVLGPAVAFDKDSRSAMQGLIENGFCHALMAGNALATHDIEAAIYNTGLGQNIYTQTLQPMGHYNHLDILNAVRRAGSIGRAIDTMDIGNGIMYACEKHHIPYVLAGSIRDDGPLPETVGNVYESQDLMRVHARKATTVITMATQLHSIAFGNMTPGYKVLVDGSVRPVYFYVVDMSEFSADKLANRGSAQAQAILTNVQDFIVNLWNHLRRNRGMNKTVRIIGVPMDLGQNHRGVDMGPSAVRYANLAGSLRELGITTFDSGDIVIPGHYALANTSLQERLPLICKACECAYALGRKAIAAGEIPIFLGGDHSASIGTVGGVTHTAETGLLWIDAHGDFNTPESSASQNVHGMALAVLQGRGAGALVDVGRPGAKVKPENVVLLGVRDLDGKEKELLKASGCTIFTMRDVDEVGIRAVLTRILKGFKHLGKIHVSLDLDVMDPLVAPGVGTPSQGGLTYREGQLIMEILAETEKLHSVDIMEINPILDIQNRTAQMAVNLVSSLFGKKIL